MNHKNDNNEIEKLILELKVLLLSSASPWLNLSEACSYCKCSKSTINKMYNLDLISRYRVLPFTDKTKGNWLYSKSELDEAIKNNRISMSAKLERLIHNYSRKLSR